MTREAASRVGQMALDLEHTSVESLLQATTVRLDELALSRP
jgi:hypothetical protein